MQDFGIVFKVVSSPSKILLVFRLYHPIKGLQQKRNKIRVYGFLMASFKMSRFVHDNFDFGLVLQFATSLGSLPLNFGACLPICSVLYMNIQ